MNHCLSSFLGRIGNCLALALSLSAVGHAAGQTAPTAARLSALFAGNAAEIENAEPAPAGQLDVEQDATYASNPELEYAEFPLSLTYGLLPRWDVSAALGGEWISFSTDNGRRREFGLGDLLLNTKFKLVDQEELWATQSLALGVKVPTASRRQDLGTGKPDFDLTWMATKDLTDDFAVDLNFGHTWIGDTAAEPLTDQFHYGVALEYQATKRLSLIGQGFAATPRDHISGTQFAVNASIGWRFSPRFSAHASFTKGFGNLIGYIGTLGVTWTFGRLPEHGTN